MLGNIEFKVFHIVARRKRLAELEGGVDQEEVCEGICLQGVLFQAI
jgi:hypothetical protein